MTYCHITDIPHYTAPKVSNFGILDLDNNENQGALLRQLRGRFPTLSLAPTADGGWRFDTETAVLGMGATYEQALLVALQYTPTPRDVRVYIDPDIYVIYRGTSAQDALPVELRIGSLRAEIIVPLEIHHVNFVDPDLVADAFAE